MIPVAGPSMRVWKDVTGVLGNMFAFGLFVSPIPTFQRVIRNQSTEYFSGMPYVFALWNCLISMWYGTPLISEDNIMIVTVNSLGAIFQLAYNILFIIYAEKPQKIRSLALLLAVFATFATVVVVSLQLVDTETRRLSVGFISSISLVAMFASPLAVINLVIRTRSVEYMPFYLSLSTFLMSTSFMFYGALNFDAFVFVPNGLGCILGAAQLVLYISYKNLSNDPLLAKC